MRKELADAFNYEIERYRQTLLHHARLYDWDTFKIKAGKLFDYVEVIELSETERRFFNVFKVILFALTVIVIAILKIDVAVYPDLLRLKNSVILLALAGSCFELYFFVDFRMYMEGKTRCYKKRKENFIRNMERDFRRMTAQSGG